jgi:hypothetical protein
MKIYLIDVERTSHVFLEQRNHHKSAHKFGKQKSSSRNHDFGANEGVTKFGELIGIVARNN